MAGERSEEKYLRAVLETLHGVELTPYDRCGRTNAVDYVFASLRSSGAVEVTTITDNDAAAWQPKLATPADQLIPCASARSWSLSII
ncbi:hypothetical protein [Nocardia sp. NPDC005745]|uniref:hypothetical protein n=1 Tax=Nocardia sp. NPDC005745 TaxID=3157061 RepID=UPI003402A964